MMKFIFGMQIDVEVFCKLMLSFWACVAKVPKTRIIYISLQCLQEKIGDKVDFLPVKDKSPLQVDTIFLSIHSHACPNYPKQQVCNIFAIF